jgi:hypothetical protein
MSLAGPSAIQLQARMFTPRQSNCATQLWGVARLGERLNAIQEVRSPILTSSEQVVLCYVQLDHQGKLSACHSIANKNSDAAPNDIVQPHYRGEHSGCNPIAMINAPGTLADMSKPAKI